MTPIFFGQPEKEEIKRAGQPQLATARGMAPRVFVALAWLIALMTPITHALKIAGLRVNRALRATHSRREANRLIEAGRLLDEATVVTNPDSRLLAGDRLEFDGRMVAWEESELGPHRYIKLHKPRGVECTTAAHVPNYILNALAAGGGHSETAVNSSAGRRVYPIGRPDTESTGIILLTSNGDIVNPLRASDGKRKQYDVVKVASRARRPQMSSLFDEERRAAHNSHALALEHSERTYHGGMLQTQEASIPSETARWDCYAFPGMGCSSCLGVDATAPAGFDENELARVSRVPVLSAAQCSAIIDEAEKLSAWEESGRIAHYARQAGCLTPLRALPQSCAMLAPFLTSVLFPAIKEVRGNTTLPLAWSSCPEAAQSVLARAHRRCFRVAAAPRRCESAMLDWLSTTRARCRLSSGSTATGLS